MPPDTEPIKINFMTFDEAANYKPKRQMLKVKEEPIDDQEEQKATEKKQVYDGSSAINELMQSDTEH